MIALIVVLVIGASLVTSYLLFPASSESERVFEHVMHEHPLHLMKSINR